MCPDNWLVPGRGKAWKIVVKLVRFKDRQSILSSAKKLKCTNIDINEDFSEAVQLWRKELLPRFKAAREWGDKASLQCDKLVIMPRGEQTQSSASSTSWFNISFKKGLILSCS